MRYEVTLDERLVRVELTPDGRFTIDDRAVAAEVREIVRGWLWSVTLDGESHEVTLLGHDPMRVDVNGTEVRFLLYRKPDGSVVSVYDACEICGAVGFYESANGLVCKNCAAPVNPQAVGQKGGCNPIPLKSSVANGSIEISEADFQAGVSHFQH